MTREGNVFFTVQQPDVLFELYYQLPKPIRIFLNNRNDLVCEWFSFPSKIGL